MCDNKDCYFISVIDIGEGETIMIHYLRDLKSVIMMQHFHKPTDCLAEYHPINNLDIDV
tara:strand:+ start:181 stop:357 length:177 start_codon:yes stop_codon:yes gene_type:complete